MIDLFTAQPRITVAPSFAHYLEREVIPEKQSREERREYEKQWRERNREKVNAYSRQWMRSKRAK